MPEKEVEDGFLSRWSRRKRQGEIVEEGEASSPEALNIRPEQTVSNGDGEDVDGAVVAEPTEEELEMQANLEAAEAIDLETLEYESDFELFMKKGVPDALKNAAMQKLWRSNPMLAVLDGLNDYDEDFGDPKLNVYKSAWEVGRGFLTDAEMNHSPADKVQAFVEKLLEDPSDAVATGEEKIEEQLEIDNVEELAVEDEDIVVAEHSELDGEGNDEDQPVQRVSIRSRIFDYSEDTN